MNEVCQNPNCPSCGKAHPNCRCFAGGGVVPESDLPDMAAAAPASGEVPASDLPETVTAQAQEVPPEDLPNEEHYGTTEQQIKAGLEGAAQGLAGPLATLAETKLLGVKPEDIAGRAKENPLTHGIAEAGALAGSMLTGVGEAGLIAKGAKMLAGSAALRGAIEGASFAASDEITKAMLGRPDGNPEEPVSAALMHVGAAGVMGALTGGVFQLGQKLIGKGIEGLGSPKVVEATEKYLSKLGESGDPLGGLAKKGATAVTEGLAGVAGAKSGLLAYSIVRNLLGKPIEKIMGKLSAKANPYVTDAVIKSLLTNSAAGVPNAIHYAQQVARGAQKIATGVEALFKAGSAEIAPAASDAAKEELKGFIEGGQVEEQIKNQIGSEPQATPAFAHGGQVTAPQPTDHFATVFPEQNTLLNAAKGRISSYLNGLRPTAHQPKLAFDPKPLDRDKHRSYNKAIELAVNPLKILDKVNKGNLTPEDMKHFTAMYPEVYTTLSKRMTERITKAQLAGEKPDYKKRQAMSLFLGAPLDSTLTPVAIQTAQAVFANKNAQQQPMLKNKKGTSSLGKSVDSYQTADQARVQRQQKA